jgi:hypothetical protein
MTTSTKWYPSSRDVKFRAISDDGRITIEGKVGRRLADDRYSFHLSEYPRLPYDQKCFLDHLYNTFGQDPYVFGQASRNTDAMMRVMEEVLQAQGDVA